jgi:carbonic anhydrase
LQAYIPSYLLLTGLLTTACVGIRPIKPHASAPAGGQAAHSIHWSYTGETGSDHWGELDPTYATCSTGTHQSPIDLVPAEAQESTLAFYYQPSEVLILNNGHTVLVNYETGSSMEVDGQRYDIVQHHYHAPSEHTINSQTFAAELHIVHKNADGQLAVVGILLEEGAENPAYGPLISTLPAHESAETDAGFKLNVTDLLPATQTAYHYSGSLTTLPCTEGVKWFVLTTPVALSADQIAALEKIFHGNNRPVQSHS